MPLPPSWKHAVTAAPPMSRTSFPSSTSLFRKYAHEAT